MSNFARSVLFVILVPVGFAYSSSSTAQATEAKADAPGRTILDGSFARYLESPGGEIDGIVLGDGTVARFAPLKRTPQAASLRPGDAVRVTGDVVSGIAGTYLVHALVTRIGVPTTGGAVSPQLATSPGNGSRSRRTGKGAKGVAKDSTQPPLATGKAHASSAAQTEKVDDLLVVDKSSVRARKKGRLETIESKASEATTGKGKTGTYSQWSRAQETTGP